MNCKRTFIVDTFLTTKQLIGSDFDWMERMYIDELDENAKYRLCRWLAYFNDNYTHCICSYSTLLFTLFENLSVNFSELLITQTDYEFEISCSFFGKLFRSDLFIDIKDIESTKYLFSISFVLGKYPGMQIRSAFEAIRKLSNGINASSLNDLFAHLFVKYENPKILTTNLSYLTLCEVDVLMFVLQGNNIRKHPKLPIPISRKESYIVIERVPKMSFTDNVLKRCIAIAKLINKTQKENGYLLEYFNRRSQRFDSIDSFINDLDFWCDVYNLLSEVDFENERELQIEQLMDYLEYMRYYSENKDFSLNGRTLESVIRAMEEWHETAIFLNNAKWLELSWEGDKIKEYKIEENGEKYLFKELTSGKDLYKESEVMKHCVFTYTQSCYLNYCSIWSLHKEANGTFEKYLTIEMQNNKVVQVRGKRNAPPNEGDVRLIEDWCQARKRTLLSFEHREKIIGTN